MDDSFKVVHVTFRGRIFVKFLRYQQTPYTQYFVKKLHIF